MGKEQVVEEREEGKAGERRMDGPVIMEEEVEEEKEEEKEEREEEEVLTE